MANLILTSAVSLLILSTVLPVLRYKTWWIRGFDFPRLQLAAFAFALFLTEIVYLSFSDPFSWFITIFTLLCLLYHSWWILPYTPVYPKEVEQVGNYHENNCIRILNANVLMTNENAGQLLEIIKEQKPHVIVLLETNDWWEKALAVLDKQYNWSLKCPRSNYYGMHLFSQLPLQEESIKYLVESDIPSMHAIVRLPSNERIRLHCVHPAPPSPTENDESSERDAELVILAESVADADIPTIVCGDLNDVAWSSSTRLFRKLSGLLDPRVGRGMYNTFHADYFFLRWPLDYLFHSKEFYLARLETLEHFGSDHFPILVELVLGKERRQSQNDELVAVSENVQSEEKDKAESMQRETIESEDK